MTSRKEKDSKTEKDSFKRPSEGEIEVKIVASADEALVSLIPPAGKHRTPSDIVCVIDISGSMSDDASIKGADGTREGAGLTVLDIVKHAVKTIIASLDEHDRICVVTFSSSARVDVKLTPTDKKGRDHALAVVEKLGTEGSTNMWAGLKLGLDTLREDAHPGKNAALFLLTDGQPDNLPSSSPQPTYQGLLKAYKDQFGLPAAIHTFGFGYNLNSELMVDLALAGSGPYAFIPDSTMTGTVFVHAVTRVLATCATELVLSIEHDNGASIQSVLGGHQMNKASWGVELRNGSMIFGQSRDYVVKLKGVKSGQPFLRATLKYLDVVTGNRIEKTAEISSPSPDATPAIDEHRLRLQFVDAIRESMTLAKQDKLKDAQDLIHSITKAFKAASHVLKTPRGGDLFKDVDGQATEALSKKEYFTKWGRHYLPSLMGAHLDQACNNFKDPGVQHYAPPLFTSIRDKIDDVFLKLPPPKPSGHSYGRGGGGGGAASAAPVSMSSYYSSAGPCFAGSALVKMAEGSTRRCDQIKKGDRVATPTGSAEVVCVLETRCPGGQVPLCPLPSGLLVTPWHPVRFNGLWTFPKDIAQPQIRECGSIFSFVLAEGHVMLIDGVECVSLAHGFMNDKVVEHPYFGTDAVTADLSRMRGWAQGHVRLDGARCSERDANGLVCRLVQHGESA